MTVLIFIGYVLFFEMPGFDSKGAFPFENSSKLRNVAFQVASPQRPGMRVTDSSL